MHGLSVEVKPVGQVAGMTLDGRYYFILSLKAVVDGHFRKRTMGQIVLRKGSKSKVDKCTMSSHNKGQRKNR